MMDFEQLSKKTEKNYGKWDSPISAQFVSKGTTILSQIKAIDNKIFWLETKRNESGRNVIMCRENNKVYEITDSKYSVRTRIYEYGGGDYAVSRHGVYFINELDQQIYRVMSNAEITPITKLLEGECYRYGDLDVNMDGTILTCVRENNINHKKVVHEIILINLTSKKYEINLVESGYDFYSCPRISPNNKHILWLSWNNPNMPWDGTELWKCDISVNLNGFSNIYKIAGGLSESICQPVWSPENIIYFVSDKTGWWNLYYLDGHSIKNLFEENAEFAIPQWMLGINSYIVFGNKVACIRIKGSLHDLLLINTNTHTVNKINLPFTTYEPYLAYSKEKLYFIASNSYSPKILYEYTFRSNKLELVAGKKLDGSLKPYISEAIPMTSYTINGYPITYFYPPRNQNFIGPYGKRPPLIVMCHGGPTFSNTIGLNFYIQYWTSRGFAVVDINYTGSTGYGRKYRRQLKGRWGVADVNDCVAITKHIIENKLVDPNFIFIKGSSSGGFTALCALIFHNIFSGGAIYYGVSCILSLLEKTHKFESHYVNELIGYDKDIKELARERSPIYHIDKINTPIIFFQGKLDKIIPIAQMKEIYEKIKQRNLMTSFICLEDEYHGFVKEENVARCLEEEYRFYQQIIYSGENKEK